MDNDQRPPSFTVRKMAIAVLFPVAHFYYCIECENELSEWIMEQSPGNPTACPHCNCPIEAEHIAQAQRETKTGFLLSIGCFGSLFLVPAAIAAVIWLVNTARQ
jgi:hypothetical protein